MTSVVNSTNSSPWEFKGTVEYVDSWFLMSTPVPVLGLWLSYLAFVLKVGPTFMKGRPPYKLTNVLVIYNVIQVLISCYLFAAGSSLLFKHGLIQTKCLLGTPEYLSMLITNYYYYFLAKVTELLDTIFFVLRKRYRQVSFLHVYHHSATVVFSWLIIKYDPSPITVFLGTVNSFVHIIMYGYYALSAFPELTKYLWWKSYITQLQLVQFCIILVHAGFDYKYSDCPPSYMVLGLVVYNLILMIVLFSNFYIKSYLNENSKTVKGSKKALNGSGLNNKNINTNNINNANRKEVHEKKER